MKQIIFLIIIGVHGTVLSQSLAEANNQFNNFEYAKAVEIYARLMTNSELPYEDLKRFVYSGYTVGEFEKVLEASKQLIQKENLEPYFHYVHGEICFGIGDYATAKKSFKDYAALESDIDVTVRIASCDQASNWKPEIYLRKGSLANNSALADITSCELTQGTISIHEMNANEISDLKTTKEIDELFLSRPFISKEDGKILPIHLEEPAPFISVTSFSIIPNTNEVLLTIQEPMNEDPVRKAAHIYSGQIDIQTMNIHNITPWMYSGFEDNSYCAHATVDESGKRIAFSKICSGQQHSDIYVTSMTNNEWSTPKKLNAICTAHDEVFPLFQGDTLLTFSSDGYPGYGKLDIYSYHMKHEEITHFKSPVNSAMDDFNLAYYSAGDSMTFTSNRADGAGEDDRYFITLREEEIIEIIPDSSDFFAFVDNWKDRKVYFDFNEYDIQEDTEQMKALVEFMARYDHSKIILEAHSDHRGEDDYNRKLSEKRAMSVLNDLMNIGIRRDQIEINNVGELKPLVDCELCTEEMHRENRVVILQLQAK